VLPFDGANVDNCTVHSWSIGVTGRHTLDQPNSAKIAPLSTTESVVPGLTSRLRLVCSGWLQTASFTQTSYGCNATKSICMRTFIMNDRVHQTLHATARTDGRQRGLPVPARPPAAGYRSHPQRDLRRRGEAAHQLQHGVVPPLSRGAVLRVPANRRAGGGARAAGEGCRSAAARVAQLHAAAVPPVAGVLALQLWHVHYARGAHNIQFCFVDFPDACLGKVSFSNLFKTQ
jgi:hypothetical protein